MSDRRGHRYELALVVDGKVTSTAPAHPRLVERLAEAIDSGTYGNTTAEAIVRSVERHLAAERKEVEEA